MSIFYSIGKSTLGLVLIAQNSAEGNAICHLALGANNEELIHNLQASYPTISCVENNNSCAKNLAAIIAFIEQPHQSLNLPLAISGTDFQQRVWRQLQQIPMGKTASYSEIAQQLSAPKAARAVAKACASNQLALVIPCHRVICSNGDISGYRWGIERKIELLRRENAINKKS